MWWVCWSARWPRIHFGHIPRELRGAWDNAKKYVEEGHLGGKHSECHKATIVGDTVGILSGYLRPSLNILIKLMSMVSIVMAGLTVMLHL